MRSEVVPRFRVYSKHPAAEVLRSRDFADLEMALAALEAALGRDLHDLSTPDDPDERVFIRVTWTDTNGSTGLACITFVGVNQQCLPPWAREVIAWSGGGAN